MDGTVEDTLIGLALGLQISTSHYLWVGEFVYDRLPRPVRVRAVWFSSCIPPAPVAHVCERIETVANVLECDLQLNLHCHMCTVLGCVSITCVSHCSAFHRGPSPSSAAVDVVPFSLSKYGTK